MYFGGNKLLYLADNIADINIEKLFMNMTKYLKEKHGLNHYKDKIAKIAKETGIALNNRKLLDIYVTDKIAEDENGKNLPRTIYIYNNTNGEFLPSLYYAINFEDNNIQKQADNAQISRKIRNDFRSDDIKLIRNRCKLFKEFEDGTYWLNHQELRGIALNFIRIETGSKVFLEILKNNDHYKSYEEKYDLWNYYTEYFIQCDYKPAVCNNFCPYKDKCRHGTNILSTVKPRPGTIERLTSSIKFHSIKDVEEDVRHKIKLAVNACDDKIYVINAQTSIGKTQIYLKLMKASDKRFLIAVPTNILKHDVYRRAKAMGIKKIMVTPSLLEILKENESEVPEDICENINSLYSSGNHRAVIPYIRKSLKEQNIRCLQDYLDELDKLRKFDGHIITTHKKFSTMKREDLSEYEIIIDEDIIYKGFMTNQAVISISDLKKTLKKIPPHKAEAIKIKQILEYCSDDKTFFTVKSLDIDEDDSDDTPYNFDVPSLCRAEKFSFLKKSKPANIEEDCIIFYKPIDFPDVKMTIVSATANEEIYSHFFRVRTVEYYYCKRAEYTGKLQQYYNKSMSRAYLSENNQTFDNLKEKYNGRAIITFKKFAGYVNGEELHFGNTEGYDGYAGDDIIVVGTPHSPPHLYTLLAYTLGLKCDLKSELKPKQLVEHNDCRFYFTTFDDESLRLIQFWMIETELEQTIGRSRLLRNDCTVTLFSNFPLQQAVLDCYEW